MNINQPETYSQELYTAEELQDLHLPGYRSPATIDALTSPDTDWQHVLSLSVFRASPHHEDAVEVLTAIRAKGTRTHSQVVSTPTGRFPNVFAQTLLMDKMPFIAKTAQVSLDRLDSNVRQTAATFKPNRQAIPNRKAPLPFITHEPLLRKLGTRPEMLQNKGGRLPLGTISLGRIIVGFSYADHDAKTDTPLWEPLIMYASALWLYDQDAIPAATDAYDNLGWTSLNDFTQGVKSREAATLVPSIDNANLATVCVRGLCLASTDSLIHDSSLLGHLGVQS